MDECIDDPSMPRLRSSLLVALMDECIDGWMDLHRCLLGFGDLAPTSIDVR